MTNVMINRRVILLSILSVLMIALAFYGGSVAYAGTYAEKILAIPDLRSYWPLTESEGSIAHDISGNGYNGTYYGVSLNQLTAPGALGVAGLWDGINDRVVLPNDSVSDTGNFTVLAWFRLVSANGYHFIFDRDNFRLAIYGNTNALGTFFDGLDRCMVSVVADTWYSVVVRYAGVTLTCILNGTPATSTVSAGISGAASTVVVGSRYLNDNYVNAYILHVAWWDRALSDSEISLVIDPSVPPTPTPTLTSTARAPQLILTLSNGNQFEIEYWISAGDIAQLIPALLLIGFLAFLIIIKLVRR